MTDTPLTPAIDDNSDCREAEALLQGDADLAVDELVTALQRVDRLALSFDLAFGNRLYVTRTGTGEYRSVFVPDGTDEPDLQASRVLRVRAIAFYNDVAPVSGVDVTETPLESLHDAAEHPEPDRASEVSAS